MTEEMSRMKQVSLDIENDKRCDDARPSHDTETQHTKAATNLSQYAKDL